MTELRVEEDVRQPAPRSWDAAWVWLFTGLVGSALVAGAVTGLRVAGTDGLAELGSSVWASWLGMVLNPAYWLFLGALVLAQWQWPARPELRTMTVGFGQDLVWFAATTAMSLSVVAAYLTFLDAGYVRAFGDWSLDLQAQLGSWGLPVVALVVTDLMAWFSHYLHHQVPALWAFHSVHHSQEQMNVLSDSRQHIFETILTSTLVFVPARALGLDVEAATALTFLSIYVGAFIHANIRTNLGPGRFLLISPQAHRVHHSDNPEHYDTNFGVILACWDYVFGTRYDDDDIYPETGITDREFPLEHDARPAALLGTWVQQTAYPYRQLLARDGGVRRHPPS